jgi:FtsP/CotA-like multicopper oxidase with cupredoxin domain
VNLGERNTYEFTVRNPQGTDLYHTHPDGRTACRSTTCMCRSKNAVFRQC